jgi:hypothetical protein
MISSYELSAVVLALQLNDPIHKDGWWLNIIVIDFVLQTINMIQN